MKSVAELQNEVKQFVDARDWNQFHDTKNLAMAMASEVGELCAILRWASSTSLVSLEADADIRSKLVDEIGDVGILLLAMCNRLGLRLDDVMTAKLAKNARNYPFERSKGKADR